MLYGLKETKKNEMLRIFSFLLLYLFSTACNPSSMEDFKEQGEQETRLLICELEKIHNRQELLKAQVKLNKIFNSLAETSIKAQVFKEKYFKEAEKIEFSERNFELNEKLRKELQRIYLIEGGKEIIEKCQEEGLQKLVNFQT